MGGEFQTKVKVEKKSKEFTPSFLKNKPKEAKKSETSKNSPSIKSTP
jgi:hypothetical protein